MTPEQFHARLWEILSDVDDSAFLAMNAEAPSLQAVAEIEAAVGMPLPETFTAFAQRTNGLAVMARDTVWPRAQEFAVGPAWTFWRGVVLLGIDAPDLPEWASIRFAHQRLVDDGVTGVLPLLKVAGDGGRVWGMALTGTLVEVSDGEVTPLACDFTDLYAEQIQALVQRQQAMAQRLTTKRAG